jgi:hypothetical protein
MIVVLKIILFFLAVVAGLTFRGILKDFIQVKKTDGFDTITIWERTKFNVKFYIIEMAIISLIVFLLYFIVMPLSIGSYA